MSNFPLYIGFRYTKARQKNQLVSFLSGISTTGLVVGVSLLIAVLSIMNGFERELREKILGLVPQAAIYQRGGMEDWADHMSSIEEHGNVVAVAPFVQLSGLSRFQKKTSPILLYGVDPKIEKRVSLIEDYVGDPLILSKLDGVNNIILGKGLADTLGASLNDKIMVLVPNKGQSVKGPQVKYLTIVGLINSETQLDTSLALMSLDNASALSEHPGKVSGLRLKIDDIFDAPHTVYDNLIRLGPGYYGSNWTRTHGNLYHAIQMSKSLIGLLMLLIVAIAVFNVVSTLVMVVIDKKGDIAILRTLGASTGEIMKIFMVQGCTIGVVGTSLGVVFGILLALGAESILQCVEGVLGMQFLKSDVYPLTYLPADIRMTDILQVSLTALVLSFVATLYPAWRASKVEPAEALRHE